MTSRFAASVWFGLLLLAMGGATSTAQADDWPQWLGPNGDSVWRETGIVDAIPPGGLPVAWRAPVGLGYGGPAVADGRVYVMDYVPRGEFRIQNNAGARERLEGEERILCFDAESGKLLWKHAYDRPYHLSFPGGPRCTPTVSGGRVFSLGAEGNLTCLDARTGNLLWSKDFARDFDAPTPFWGRTSHPLADGDRVYCIVGGDGRTAMAFDAATGRTLWSALSAKEPGYCSPMWLDRGGARQLLVWHAESVNALVPASGEVLWSVPLVPRYGMAISTPRQQGDLLLAVGYGEGALLQLADGAPEIVWKCSADTGLDSANVTPFLKGDTIYGCDIESGAFQAVRIADGEHLWQTFQPTTGLDRRQRYGSAFIVKQADRFWLFSETGDLILARLSPQQYEELGRFHVLEPTNRVFGRHVVWTHPAFAQRSLFARNDKELVRVDLAAE